MATCLNQLSHNARPVSFIAAAFGEGQPDLAICRANEMAGAGRHHSNGMPYFVVLHSVQQTSRCSVRGGEDGSLYPRGLGSSGTLKDEAMTLLWGAALYHARPCPSHAWMWQN